MSDATANALHHRFEVPALHPDTFTVLGFTGEDAISQPFRYEIVLASADGTIDFADVVNQPGTLSTQRAGQDGSPGAPVPMHGVVVDAREDGWMRSVERYRYRVVLVPRLWRLSLQFQSRIFQDRTTEEIVTEVLQEAGLSGSSLRFDLSATYAPREYCVQYQETDLAFVSRLLEYEGIQYFFEHTDREEVLVMTDDRSSHPALSDPSTLAYNDRQGTVPGSETVHRFTARERLVTGSVVLRDYNYRTPDTDLEAESQINADMPGMRYEYGQHFADTDTGRRLARVRNEEIECGRRVLHGTSDCPALRPGHVFTLDGHPRPGADGDYLVTHVRPRGTHAGSAAAFAEALSDPAGGDGSPAAHAPRDSALYENTFTCIPAEVPYRPPRTTPVPRVSGIMTARTETSGGDYAHVDEDGRYHLKMHFDRGPAHDGTATRPIRRAQPNSGPGYGIHFPEHADTEMVWACVDGNPDRPLALSSVPNPSQASPVTSENKTENLIRTYAGNQVLIDDHEGATKIVLSTPGGHSLSIDDGGPKVSITTSGGHSFVLDDDLEVCRLMTTSGHTLVMSDADRIITAMTEGGNEMVMDDQHRVVRIGTTDGAEVSLHDADQVTRVASAGGHTVELSDAANTLSVTSASGANSVVIDDNGGGVTIEALQSVTLQSGASSIELKADGSIDISGLKVTINGLSITLDAQATCAVKAGVKAEVAGGGGMSSVALDPSAATVSGTMVNVNGQGPVNITSSAIVAVTGTMIKVN